MPKVRGKSESGLLNKILHIVASFLLSIVFIWGVGFFFCNSLIYYQFDPILKKYIHAPNTTYKHRTEGIATTYKGKLGINGIEDITKEKRDKVVVWGDSYIEAHQVNDQFKVPQIVSQKLLKTKLGDKLMCFGVGMSGDSVADYYFDIPKYEKNVKDIKAHFIVITSIDDTLPDRPDDNIRGIFKSNPLRLVHDNWHPEFQKEKKILSKLGLYFIWEPMRSGISKIKEINFIPFVDNGHLGGMSLNGESYSQKKLADSWNFLFRKLKEQTDKKIVLVYCPVIPKIENGKVITIDENAGYIRLFAEIAEKFDLAFLDARSNFLNFYKKYKVFPRGFLNTMPGEGHFNRYGHMIVAEVILDYILTDVSHK